MTKSADNYRICDPWRIIEEGWHKDRNLVSESVFSLGNEYMGVRGYAEEGTSEQTLRGSYFNGIYEEMDLEKSYKGIVTKTHFMVNAADYLYTEIFAGNEKLDMAVCEIRDFKRVLDMREGTVRRSFDWHTKGGAVIHFEFIRFLVMEKTGSTVKTGAAYQKIAFNVTQGSAEIKITVGNDFNSVHGWNKKNYWNMERREFFDNGAAVLAATKGTGQQVFSGFTFKTGGCEAQVKKEGTQSASYEFTFKDSTAKGWVEKSVVNYALKERKGDAGAVWEAGLSALKGDIPSFETALEKQCAYWNVFWQNADIRIEGDPLNQQGIRFCIFQMHQTYHGLDPYNNIGAKGLTGEAYNGHAFWDTETYCLPFYLFSDPAAARNLLGYRYATLGAAKERAKMLDCRGACYPVATLNGEEACNLWQHASLQFQPSTAVAFGIDHYMKITGDTEFLYSQGAEMLVEISRFLESRGGWNNDGTGFGFYAVMGPDEFHMMVNHNTYTNYMAKKTFEYTEKVLAEMEKNALDRFIALREKTGITREERDTFARCAEKMIILYDGNTKLYEQHEGYFTLPRIEISKIPVTDFPLYHNWSYDRIYRTSMIKQPDVLMFMFLYLSEFSEDVKRKNYDYYEPNTIHESSLSPSIHSIFACELGKQIDAFRFFAFATRMDLDNYNRNSGEGLHTTSIAAAWVNIVYGFAGLRSDAAELALSPILPKEWTEYEFGIFYHGAHIRVKVTSREVTLSTNDTMSEAIPIHIYGKPYQFDSTEITIRRE